MPDVSYDTYPAAELQKLERFWLIYEGYYPVNPVMAFAITDCRMLFKGEEYIFFHFIIIC